MECLAGDRSIGHHQHLGGEGLAVHVRTQRADVVRELLGQHRVNATGQVRGAPAALGLAVHGPTGRHEAADVGDVHPQADALTLALHGDGIVVVLRSLGVDGDDPLVAHVTAVGVDFGGGAHRRVGLVARLLAEAPAQILMGREGTDGRTGRGRRAVHLHHLCPTPLETRGHQVAHAGIAPATLEQRYLRPGLECRAQGHAATVRQQFGHETGAGAAPCHAARACPCRRGPGPRRGPRRHSCPGGPRPARRAARPSCRCRCPWG